MTQRWDADVVIIGTGAGGGTLAHALKDSGARVLLLDRGGFLPQEVENWSAHAVFGERRYRAREVWRDGDGRDFHPGVHYFVGGNTKLFGAALPRMRRGDFDAYALEDGVSPAWPIGYDDLEPYYERAEALYGVHATAGEDPTEAPRRCDYPFPAVPDEPVIAALRARLQAQGLHPYSIPLGIDLRHGGACIRCATCDGFPCRVLAKSDADVRCVRPALRSPTVTLRTGALVERLVTSPGGERVIAAEGHDERGPFRVSAGAFVVACGAVNSAALLLRSAGASHPDGLANSSGQVGRNYMGHVHTALMAVDPRRTNPTRFQKTIAVNDYYHGDGRWPYPMGTIQLIGKLQGGMITADLPLLGARLSGALARRGVDWWAMSEDTPDPDRRVTLDPDGTIRVRWRPSNVATHRRLVAAGRRMLRRAGYPLVLSRRLGIETNSHQCGTVCFGDDPSTSVLDSLCAAHDVENLHVVDASFFPSSGVLNPVLTIAAQALRVGERLASPA